MPRPETAEHSPEKEKNMEGMDYLKQDIYNSERAKMRFVLEWEKTRKELRKKLGYGRRKREGKK